MCVTPTTDSTSPSLTVNSVVLALIVPWARSLEMLMEGRSSV